MRIGLIDGSFKPYHAGHHALVTMAARENDVVKLFVSLTDRKRKGQFPIYGADMQVLWEDFIKPVLPHNVQVTYASPPVKAVYEELGNANDTGSQDVYRVYADPVDTRNKYAPKSREKYFGDLWHRGGVIFVSEEEPGKLARGEGTPDVSGTAMRVALESGDVAGFSRGLPGELQPRAYEIFELLGGVPPEGRRLARESIRFRR